MEIMDKDTIPRRKLLIIIKLKIQEITLNVIGQMILIAIQG